MIYTQNLTPKGYMEDQSGDGITHPISPPPSPPPTSPVDQTPPSRQSTLAIEPRESEPTSSPRQQYLDSLQPPSDQDFDRLSSLQEDREKEHRQRNNDLRRQDRMAARKSMEARRDFMKTKALEEEKREGSKEASQEPHCSVFGRSIHQLSDSQSRVNSGNDNSEGSTAEENEDSEILKAKAAIVIQRSYRGYRVRREMQGLGLDASTRWTHAIRDAQWKELTKPRARGDPAGAEGINSDSSDRPSTSRSQARRNWMKAATIARRAGGDEDSDNSASSDSSLSSPDSEELTRMNTAERDARRQKKQKAQAKRRKHARMMGLQYFFEMVDLKHRYGSNLRTYHEHWKRSDTNENFFFWLDYGEGRALDLAACPRERLDRECVRYLNREERAHYLVKVDSEGRLVWAKNGIRIDTTVEWKDSIHGIVPVDDPTPAFSPEVEGHTQDRAHNKLDSHHPRDQSSSRSSSSSYSSREDELEAARAAKYANTELDNAKGVKKIRHVSAATIFNRLLRKSVRKNTWIFVADTSFRLYVGIKASGAFQHSSFLHGGRISAAGLIKVKNGRLSSLSPLSGHYRPPAANFRAFVHSLEDEGVDMSHVSISRSYAVLVGLEMYVKTRRKGKEVLRSVSLKKTKVFKPEEARRMEEEAWDKSQSAAKERRVLEKEREENKTSTKILQKLGLRPRTLSGRDVGSSALEQGDEGQTRS
ncbi:hypothetical protein GQX73_g1401 [Xylaria multiplex]|uniref:IQ domain-containing protein IQM6 n=1 Tax=Xylaria multiplex TaxID=323545 RepID=A0A7C8ITU8_9PEZI|nr:hypothetical protein GQX73_g1401 [Xylaria multiplex]